ncbi:DNA-binding transcriptional regulator OxyR [Taibaiella sp. KBW10]|uniref:hydrogen peroxide-inducible genes activator n=1 Tax=Taibaiella sp. KBW10 TaxID=2153357 RepID=UPI000F59074D|nr:hydrogen peroxide-inducible genes activator [Taibaiella sp. KBW10]RQO31176.1 DNA-binding transcriptional regulator OxyR [Taibaiella sp. KBW10]
MTLTQLEYVVAVATYKSFVAAAEKCFVTQPTLSMQIHKLEEEFGVKIFDRNKHPITATEIGAQIVAQAKNILSESAKINQLIQQSQSEVNGVFKLAVIPTISPYVLPKFLAAYAAKHPKIKLVVTEMQTDEIVHALQNNEIDAGLLSTPLENNNVKEYPLFFEPLVGYFSEQSEALVKRVVSPKDIDLNNIWLLNEGNCLRNQVLNLCSDNIMRLQEERPYSFESGSVDMLRKMVDMNGGVAVLPELATFDFNEEAQDRIRYFENPEPVREISLVTNNHFVKLAVLQTIIDELLEMVPEKMKVQKSDRKVLRIQTAKL